MTQQTSTKRQHWQQHIDNWKASGQSQKAYCEANNLKAHQFWYWLRQCQPPVQSNAKPSNNSAPTTETPLIPVVVTTNTSKPVPYSLELPSGIRIHGVTTPTENLTTLTS